MAEDGNGAVTPGAGGQDPAQGQVDLVGAGNLMNSGFLKNSGLSEEWDKIQADKNQGGSEPQGTVDPVQQALSNPTPDSGNNPEPPAATVPAEEPSGASVASESSSTPDTPPAGEPLVIESPLFGGKANLGGGDNAPASLSFENMDQVNSYLKETHGIENMDQLSERLSSIPDIQNQNAQNQNQLNQYNSLFEGMDPDLWEAVNAYAQGKDWRSTLATPTVDFSKDAAAIDVKTLVDAFAPGKITAEDWQEYNDPEGDQNVKRLVNSVIETSKSAFTNTKQQKQQSAQQEVQKQQQRVQEFNTSLVNAKQALETEYSNIDPRAVSEIEDAFTSNKFLSLFFEENGTLKKDAFVNYAMAKHGKNLVAQFEAAAMRKAQNTVTQDILERTPETPRDNRGSASTAQSSGVSSEVQGIVDGMMGLNKRHF